MKELASAGEPEPPDMGVLPPVDPTEEDIENAKASALKVRDMLGLDASVWNDAKMAKLAQQVPNFSLRKITAKLLMTTQFKSIAQLEKALEAGAKMLSEPNLKESHNAAGKMMSIVGETIAKISDQLKVLSVVAEPGKMEGEEVKEEPLNLPPLIPQVNVQVNLNGANQPPRLPPAIPITGSAKPDIDVAQ